MSAPRVRFDTELAPDESIPGALVKAVSAHVLYSTKVVLNSAGIPLTSPGLVQILERDQLTSLAHVIRCDPDRLDAVRGQRVMTRADGITHQRVHYGSLHLLRSHLELKKRRISPLSLQTADHHRLPWLNGLLPYCPISFEKLIYQCPACEKDLGWRMSWGVGVCEFCEHVVPPSTERLLPIEMRDDYSFFARLCSPVPGEWEATRNELPQILHGIGSATLIRLVMRMGFLMQTPMVENVRMHAASELPGEVLAKVVTDGARMLRTWPTGFIEWAHHRADALRSDHTAFLRFRTNLRRLSFAPAEGDEQSALVLAAFPDLALAYEHAFSSAGSVYLHNETARRIGISANKLRNVREAGLIEHVALPGQSRLRVQYPVAVIDRVADLVRSTPVISHFPGKFGLPTYAIEQLVHDGLLHQEIDPAVKAIRESICVRPDSVEVFVARMNDVARTDEAPAGAVALRTAARRIGGRLKPWSHIVTALASGQIPVWSTTKCFHARKWLVRPEDIGVFDDVTASDTVSFGADMINLDDLGELLNIAPKMIEKISADLKFDFIERGRAECMPLDQALDVSRRMSTTAEVGAQLGIHSKGAERMMRRLKIKPISVGWCRQNLIDCGYLRPI